MSESVNVSEIITFGDRIDPGKYQAKLASVEGKQSKAGKDMVVAIYEITKGPQEGNQVTAYYTMFNAPAKKGGINAPGIAEMLRTMAKVGKPFVGSAFPTTSAQAAKVFHASVFGKQLDILAVSELSFQKDESGNKVARLDDEGKQLTNIRVKVLGPASVGLGTVSGAARPVDHPNEYKVADEFD